MVTQAEQNRLIAARLAAGQPFGGPPVIADDFAPPVAPSVGPAGPGWARLWARIPGSYAARSLAIFSLQRSGYRLDPDTVIVRPLVNGQRMAAGAGLLQSVYTFDTLSVITGARIMVLAGGGSPFAFTVSARAGSDGGYAIATEQNPAPLTSLYTTAAETQPIAIAPVSARPNNQWTTQVTGDVGTAATTIHWTWYGFALWQPSGQIQ